MTSDRTRVRGWLVAVLLVLLVIAAVRWPSIVETVRTMTAPAPVVPNKSIPSWVLDRKLTPLPGFERFFDFMAGDPVIARRAESTIEDEWADSHTVLLLELARIAGGGTAIRDLLARTTGQPSTWETEDWWKWIWRENPGTPPHYSDFKAVLYSGIDPRFVEYFDDDPPATIRLDEIRWGGVKRDGIPPLEGPERIAAAAAEYLDDDNVIFGVEVNGEAVAYPKRIMGRHEMVKDTVGGESINGVFCTLCGSMIVYRTTADGVHHDLGTSGLLYRSNKLMYDRATQSLWSTLKGVVTSTWGAWRQRHPETSVLSLKTGHTYDYGEGEAYKHYFSSHNLMFSVPERDERLRNKDEVLAIRFLDFPDEQLAISADYLNEHRVYHTTVASNDIVVLTDTSGSNRVYETNGHTFSAWAGEDAVSDDGGTMWRVTESALVQEDGDQRLVRLPAHRAFWFGWYAAYPGTRLVM